MEQHRPILIPASHQEGHAKGPALHSQGTVAEPGLVWLGHCTNGQQRPMAAPQGMLGLGSLCTKMQCMQV